MYHRVGVGTGESAGDWLIRTMKGTFVHGEMQGFLSREALKTRVLPWFSIVGVTTVVIFCIAFGAVLSYFLTREILVHDASLTSQFITSVERVQSREAQLGEEVTLGQLLDHRTKFSDIGIDPALALSVRTQYFDHIRVMPDVRLANVFGRDRSIVWSTNPALRGHGEAGNAKLEEAFSRRQMVTYDVFSSSLLSDVQRIDTDNETSFVEVYIPLLDAKGQVIAVVDVVKEPRTLLQSIRHGKMLIWASIILGALVLYIVPFWIFRCADGAFGEQQRRLREAETLCLIGEMSAAVAHGIRNPLATIRTSAELALDADPEAARKNATDIIAQVDRLGKWVRELLVFSRPVAGENESINVDTLVGECLLNISTQLQKNQIACKLDRPPEGVPLVIGNRGLAHQALASIISNAIEAMPGGGTLDLQLLVSTARGYVDIIVSDTGSGMSPTQMDLVFKPFYTTKRNGLGLGMAQVKRIMERFGGAVILRSQKGKGTQACLRFHIA